MATLGTEVLTLADWAKRLDPDGKTPMIAEMLEQTNEILLDAPFKEGNLPTGHKITIRSGLPDVAWRLLNKGVPKSKSTTDPIEEMTAMLEARSEVDEKLAKLNGNLSAFRLSESTAFVEAMNQEQAQTMFYGNSGLSPEEYTGLSPRYSDLSADNGKNIISGAGAGSDNSSIWLIVWGPETVFGIFPKGSKAGLEHQDLGLQDAFDADGNRFRAYMDLWRWDTGIALKDWRYAVRIPNIDISNLVGESSAADLTELMIKAMHVVPNIKKGKAVFYMNRTCYQMLDIQRRDAVISGGQLDYPVVDGKVIPHFRNIPVRLCDALIETEAVVA